MTTAAPLGRLTSPNSDSRPFVDADASLGGQIEGAESGLGDKGILAGPQPKSRSPVRVRHANRAASEHCPVALGADRDTRGRLVGPGMFHAEPSLDRGLEGMVEYAVIAEATNSLDRDPSRRDRFTERLVFGARIDERQELSLARQALDPVRSVGASPRRTHRFGQTADPVEGPCPGRDRTLGRIDAKAVRLTITPWPPGIVAVADLDGNSGQGFALVVDHSSVKRCRRAEHQVDLDRFLLVEDATAVGVGIVLGRGARARAEAADLVPGEAEALRGPGDLEEALLEG